MMTGHQVFDIMWEAEKRSVSMISALWKERDEAQKFIIDLANTGDAAALHHDLSSAIRPSLRIKS